MGRKPGQSGAQAIRDAEYLFGQSVEIGRPDFTYVALAIGNTPHAPPLWAVLACIELRQRSEGKPALGNSLEIENILDKIIRFYDRKQRLFEKSLGKDSFDALDNYRPASLRSAILHVLKANDYRTEKQAEASDDWFRDIRKAWEWEQKHDLAPSSFFHFEEGNLDEEGRIKGRKRWLQTTSRIDRVLMRSAALENGDPEDLAKWAWITKVLIQNEMIEQQQPDKQEM